MCDGVSLLAMMRSVAGCACVLWSSSIKQEWGLGYQSTLSIDSFGSIFSVCNFGEFFFFCGDFPKPCCGRKSVRKNTPFCTSVLHAGVVLRSAQQVGAC